MSAHRRSNMVVKRKREPPPESTLSKHTSLTPPPLAQTAGAGKGANKLISHLCSL